MKKVFLTSLHLAHGGVEFVVSNLANALVEQGVPVEILCTYRLGEPAYELDPRVQVTYLLQCVPNKEEMAMAKKEKAYGRLFLAVLKGGVTYMAKYVVLAKAMRRIKDGIILASRHEDAKLLARFGHSSVMKIAHIHMDISTKKNMEKEIGKYYKKLQGVVTLTEAARREVEGLLPKGGEVQVMAIPNFILPLEKVSKEKKKTILAVGRLHEDKGFSRLLGIFRKVHNEHPFWALEIIGEGPLQGMLENLIKEYGLSSSVSLLGSLPNELVRDRMSEASIYAMTSLAEGFGIVLVEAMDAFMPVVAYDVPVGPRAILRERETGFLIPDGEESLFIEKLAWLMEEEALRKTMGQKAHEEAKKYHQPVVVKKWMDLFQVSSSSDKRHTKK